jgi:hypothetical protein
LNGDKIFLEEDHMLTYSELVQWMQEQPEIQGVNLSYILELPDPLRQTLQKMLHDYSMTLGEFSEDIKFPIAEAEVISQILVEKGYLIVTGEEDEDKATYRLRLAKTRGRKIDIDL